MQLNPLRRVKALILLNSGRLYILTHLFFCRKKLHKRTLTAIVALNSPEETTAWELQLKQLLWAKQFSMRLICWLDLLAIFGKKDFALFLSSIST